nr:hypothetical protein BaRGS_030773 [Batillaria attramentaria]
MVNKHSGTFNRNDEEAFETFAIYCGLALHHAKLYDKIRRSEQKYRVALEVLSYHGQCTEEELNHLRALPVPDTIPNITDYTFSPWDVDNDHKPVHVLYMFRDLFSPMRYDMLDLMRFTLTVRKNYRNVPYHNWVHAFSVAHSMYTVIKTCKHQLSHLECLALFVACLCHDLDHRGKTNSFMVKFWVTFGHSILATDLALFFSNHSRLKDIISKTNFSWDITEHRDLVMGISMTACDLCAMYKPWQTQLDLVYVIMEEFWQQGDEEKLKGMVPMPMMDRDKQNELPQLEVGFILGICLPCYKLLSEIVPETEPMLAGVTDNLKRWQQLADEHKKLEDIKNAQFAIEDNPEPDKDRDKVTNHKVKDTVEVKDAEEAKDAEEVEDTEVSEDSQGNG